MITSTKAINTKQMVRSISLAIVFTLITAASAKCRLYVPFTEIPFTLQTMAVVLAGLVLGSRLAALSQFQYMMLGLAGAPVFASGIGGTAAFFMPSFGYVPGFIIGAYLTGLTYEKLGARGFRNAALAGIIGTCAIYLIGTPYLAAWTMIHTGKPALLCAVHAWSAGMAPFIAVDILKAVAAAAIVNGTFSVKRMVV
jgi:biotin transport system substrate-specific component